MRIHYFQHAPCEGLGRIEGWLRARGHTLSGTRLYAGETPPTDPEAFDWLVVMGGPMNIYQHRDHPWLPREKQAIRATVAAGRRILGVCLGSQLLADVLGGKVFQNAEREIGWFPVRAVPEGKSSPFAFPPETQLFHWHGDTFSLPPGAVRLAESDACAQQAFAVGSRILGLQCHPELTPADISGWVTEMGHELTPGQYVQTAAALQVQTQPPTAAWALLDRLLTTLEKGA